MISANAAGMRKRRIDLDISPDPQVSLPAPKHRLVAARSNISQYFQR
jgi:hypothetical protein